MIEVGRTRYGRPIVMSWHWDENGLKVLEFQVFANIEEIFDAFAVFSLLAARKHLRDKYSASFVEYDDYASYYELELQSLRNRDKTRTKLGPIRVVEMVRYAESLLNIAFRKV